MLRHRGRCVVQIDRLEKDLSDVRRQQEAQAATTAVRAQTTGVLEEYRTRAQQALKRANEVTGQTTAENKRLEVRGFLRGRLRVSPDLGTNTLFGTWQSLVALLSQSALVGCRVIIFSIRSVP